MPTPIKIIVLDPLIIPNIIKNNTIVKFPALGDLPLAIPIIILILTLKRFF